MTTRPAATRTSPVTYTARAPKRDAKVEVTLAAGIIVADRGSTARAARSGL
jgi:hypothetical protein